MKWKKVGQLFCPENRFPWMASHAANPFGMWLTADTLRVYFTSRDTANRSHIAWCDLDARRGFKLHRLAEAPVLTPGSLGLFDDSGAAVGCVVNVGQRLFLYYLGWNLAVTVPWRNTIGLAITENHASGFQKFGRVPILDRSEEDPYSISYPAVLFEAGRYRMWYGSNLAWGSSQDTMQHVIKYAESADGIHWRRWNQVAIPLAHPGEYAISKPFVLNQNGLYRMWYSFRSSPWGPTYRIGYAESDNGLNWTRKDELAGIEPSATGWDSEMICYPFVFCHRGKWWMLYNGNGYGRTGFGLAVAEE